MLKQSMRCFYHHVTFNFCVKQECKIFYALILLLPMMIDRYIKIYRVVHKSANELHNVIEC